MSYYPLFFNLAGLRIVVVGGGQTAYAKCSRLCRQNCRLTVISPRHLAGFESLEGAELIERAWKPEDLQGAFLVIAATDSKEEDARIAAFAKEQNILCNAVDDPEISTAIFGAVVQKEELCIGISTSGASPSAARYLKQEIAREIPDWFDEILQSLHTLRPYILEHYDPQTRTRLFHALFDKSLAQKRALSDKEIHELLEAF